MPGEILMYDFYILIHLSDHYRDQYIKLQKIPFCCALSQDRPPEVTNILSL